MKLRNHEKSIPLYSNPIWIFLFLVFVCQVQALDVDFYDTYAGQGSTNFDKISWVDTFPPTYFTSLGVDSPINTPIGYCVNEDRNIDSNFEFCITKDSNTNSLCDSVMPITPVTDSSSQTNWYNAGIGTGFLDIGSGGNSFYESSKTNKRGQINYYYDSPSLLNDTGFRLTTPSTFDDIWLSEDIILYTDSIKSVGIYIKKNEAGDDLVFKIRSSLTGSDLVSETIDDTLISTTASWQQINFETLAVNNGQRYYFILSCPTCDNLEYTWYQCDNTNSQCIDDTSNFSSDGGSSWGGSASDRSLRIYQSNCTLGGVTSNSANYDYYFIDETFNQCDSDGSETFEIRGYYGVSQHILVSDQTCAIYTICDTDHDGQTSTSPLVKPTDPCKIEPFSPLICSDSSECWNDEICDGAHFEYGGLCDGDLVDIVVEEFADNCGGNGTLVTIDTSDQDNSCQSQGYPTGYICDETLDDVFYNTEIEVYDGVCKGTIGNSCTMNSDCYHTLDCNDGFCGYNAVATFIDDESDNKNYTGVTINFDASLSFSSDNNISYYCWSVNEDNKVCKSSIGALSDCNTYCNGAIYSLTLSPEIYSFTFNNGGNYNVGLQIGNGALYSDSYSESYCISGDGNYCYSCSDNLQNDNEIDVDWGGRCGFQYFLKCNNGILDNVTNETSIDYGGNCGNCDNTSINQDEDLVFLITSGLIQYPFSNEQCETTQQVKGGIVVFFLIIGSIIIIPLLFLLLLLLLLLILFGTGAIGLLIAGIRSNNKLLSIFQRFIKNNNKNNKK